MRGWAGVAIAVGTLLLLPGSVARAQDDQASVEIHDNSYSPAELHVVVGETVTWTDLGGAHSVTSGDNGVSFDSSPSCVAGLNCMATGDTYSHQFQTVERVTYHCRVHGNAMVGTIVVDPGSTTTTEPSTTTSTTTTLASTTTSSSSGDASAAPTSNSDQTTISQYPLPSAPSRQRSTALPRAISGANPTDDVRPWALLAVAIAAGTAIAGAVLVHRGRVPFG